MQLGRPQAFLASLFVLALATLSFSAQAQSPLSAYTQQQTEFLPVDEAYELSVIGDGEQRALLQWLIAPDYYLYRHAFDAKARTAYGDIELTLAVPDGLAKTDEFFGDVEVYYGAVDASLELAETAELIELSITYQAAPTRGCVIRLKQKPSCGIRLQARFRRANLIQAPSGLAIRIPKARKTLA